MPRLSYIPGGAPSAALCTALAAALFLPACRTAGSESEPSPAPVLLEGYAGYHRAVSTDSAAAQRWFDQGLQLLYGYNHDEAIRSFERAAELDPNCALAWWGSGYAHGLHINKPVMGEQASIDAYEASREALARIEFASPSEAALIRALAARYAMPVPEDRTDLDLAYAEAMQAAWRAFPDDPDVGALYAESLMDLQPWDLWTAEGEPKGRTLEIVDVLERAIAVDRDHPGANHFYIHTVEASPEPARGIPSAELLVDLVPGSGHLVHMPAHIYARVGRWDEAADANVRAIAADRAYFAEAPAPDFYSIYFIHNIHFLAWAAMMEGRYETAMNAARELVRDVPGAFLEANAPLADGLVSAPYHVMIRFGRWDDMLAEPEPPAYRMVSRIFWRYGRGVALSSLGRPGEARAEQAEFEALVAELPEGWFIGVNEAEAVLPIASAMLEGEIAFREGQLDEAYEHLREGVRLEDELTYDEPRGWMQPVRHALGALLVAGGRYAQAEAVYLEDLQINPGNGWAWIGLERAYEGQQMSAEAERARAKREALWKRSDVEIEVSCYCALETSDC